MATALPLPARVLREPWIFGALLLITALLYSISLHAPFIYDDVDQILLNPAIQSTNLADIFSDRFRLPRLLMNLTFWFNWRVSGPNVWSYHLFNILLHLANAALLRTFLKRILPAKSWLPLVASAFFLLHPLQTESVSYVMGRISLLEAFAYLAVLTELSRKPRRRWLIALILAVSPTFKETTLLLPLVCLLYDFTLDKPKGLRQSAYYFIPWITGPLWFFWSQVSRYNAVVGFDLFPRGEYFLVQMHYLLFRLGLLFSPWNQSIQHQYPQFSPWIGAQGVIGTLVLLALAAIAFKFRKREPLMAFWVGFFLITLAPIGTILQIVNPFAEYRLYLSNISPFLGLSWALMFVAKRWVRNLRSPVLIPGAALLACAVFTSQRNFFWKDERQLVERSVALYPQSYRLQAMLGGVLEEQGQADEAEKAYLESDRLNSMSSERTLRPKVLLIQLYERQGRWAKARALIESLPVEGLSGHVPLEYFQHYLCILSAMGDRKKFQVVLAQGLKTYPEAALTARVLGSKLEQ